MAVKNTDSAEHYIGLSTDTKPVAVFSGSTFTALNTGEKWIWDGQNWIEDLSLIYALSLVIPQN